MKHSIYLAILVLMTNSLFSSDLDDIKIGISRNIAQSAVMAKKLGKDLTKLKNTICSDSAYKARLLPKKVFTRMVEEKNNIIYLDLFKVISDKLIQKHCKMRFIDKKAKVSCSKGKVYDIGTKVYSVWYKEKRMFLATGPLDNYFSNLTYDFYQINIGHQESLSEIIKTCSLASEYCSPIRTGLLRSTFLGVDRDQCQAIDWLKEGFTIAEMIENDR